MRAIVFHRRAASYLSRMPHDRAAQVRDALVEIARLENVASYLGMKQMIGGMAGWSRLRIGNYRAIM